MSILSDSTTITFGQSNDLMKYVHKFLKSNGVENVDWDDNKFDEKTALSLLLVNQSLKCIQFVANCGFNSDAKRYVEGTTVVINAGTNYYSSWNAEKSTGVIIMPTTGRLMTNGLFQSPTPLNPLRIAIMTSPLEKALSNDSVVVNLTGNKESNSILAKTTELIVKNSKSTGGVVQGEIVYLRPDSVIPSFSDIIIGNELSKIMKAGVIISKGIEFVNDINTLGVDSKQFQDNLSYELNKFLDKDKEHALKTKEKTKSYDEIINSLSENKQEIKAQTFNQNGMFIKNLITDTVIYIPFRPDSVEESYSVSWQDQNTRGSSHSTYGYELTSGSSPSITFDFDVGALAYYMTKKRERNVNSDFQSINYDESLIRKNKNSLNTSTEDTEQIFNIVTNYLNSLKALAYPLYTDGLVTPPSCYVSIARTFRFVGVCTNVSISHNGPLYIKPQLENGEFVRENDTAGDQMFMNYSVTLNFNKIVNQDFSADVVEVYGDNWTGGLDGSQNSF